MIKRRSKKKGPVVAKKTIYDNINFESLLEVYMYKALKTAGIEFEYEGESFEVLSGFDFDVDSYERQSNGKGNFENRGHKKIKSIKYTPDFVGSDFIIEVKGRANETFPLRWKMFKYLMIRNADKRVLYKPQTQSECDMVVELILNKRNGK